jgi:phage tail-like protein
MARAPVLYLGFGDGVATPRLEGLELDAAGALVLARLPGAAAPTPDASAPALSGPAGVAVAPDGTVYAADPDGHRVLRTDCDGIARPLPCLTGPGDEVGRVSAPRGVLVGPRDALYVADAGNDRVQVVDLGTLAVRDVWDGLAEPWDLAADAACGLYVVERGARRVRKLDADGRVLSAFEERVARERRPADPTQVVVAVVAGAERVIVVDRGPGGAGRAAVLAYDTDGAPDGALAAELTRAVAARLAGPPAGLAGDGPTLYVGDPTGGRVLAFALDGRFLGAVPRYRGAVAGLALDARGRLIVSAGAGAVATLAAGAGRAEEGRFVAGPLPASDGRRRVRAIADPLPAGCHVRLFTALRAPADPPPPLPEGDDPLWRPAGTDALDLLAATAPGTLLWLGGRLSGDGRATPALRRLAIEPEPRRLAERMPSVYRDAAAGPLEGLLALAESLLSDEEDLIDGIPRLLDPWAAPDGEPAAWLDWLAGRVAAELEAAWPGPRRREAVATAFERHGRRGTAEGLAEAARLHLDARVTIEEPARRASLWSLGEPAGSALGVTTMLTAAEAAGAVLDTTAVLDRSHLIGEDEIGAPLFEDLAHRFTVRAHAADLARPGAREGLVRLIDRERPAHTAYHLCAIEPRLSVGAQALVGIDAVVGGPAADEDRAAGGAVGAARVGRDTTLT